MALDPDAARRETVALTCALAVAVIFAAGLLVGVRDLLGNTNVALILVVLVVAAATIGGRAAGITSAIVAAVSFNFFHTEPYRTLRITDREDVITVVLLLVVGIVVGELALWRRRSRSEAEVQAAGAHRLESVLTLMTADAPVDQTWRAVQDAVQAELGARSARFEPGAAAADVPLLSRSGRVVPTLSHWTGRGFQLPGHTAIPVVSAAGVVGHIAVEGTPGRAVSIDERRVAVALADLLALALTARSGRVEAMG